MVRIECDCQICKTNAAKIGASFPLKADIPERLAKTLKGKKAHGLVYDAHGPSAISAAVRRATGVVPVA